MRVCSIFSIVLLSSVAIGAPLKPQRLSCEYLENPIAIDNAHPRLGWSFALDGRNQRQTGFEISVGTSKSPSGDWWSSGKVYSAQSTNIVYSGPALNAFTRYYWRVKTYDERYQSAGWSETMWFETAMFSKTDWHGLWIDDGTPQFQKDEDFYKDDAMPLFRKEFFIKANLDRAIIYIAGVGYHEAFLNGNKIGDHVLDPGWTNYAKEVQYVAHDVTKHMLTGTNAIGVMLGNGWWNPLPLRLFGSYNLRDFQQNGRPCLKAEIHLLYKDGSRDVIPSDESWQTTPGPVIRNSVYLGEHFDARRDQYGWTKTNAPVKNWRNSRLTEGPTGTLRVQLQPAIKVTAVVKPTKINVLKPGVYIVDMGQNFAGVARIKVKGKSGDHVTLRYGEALLPDGSLNGMTTTAGHIKDMWKVKGGPGAPLTAWQEDSYILSGGGMETWAPRFTFHGFRFIEITGWPGKPSLQDIEGLRMNADLPKVGEFACSNDLFNKIHQATQWTFLSNVFSVQSDCPGREKMGYGADIVATANSFLFNYDMSNFYQKTIQDFANDQLKDGGITEIAPFTGISDRGIGGLSGPLGWQLAFPYLQKRLYEFYADTTVIARHYNSFKRQIDFLQASAVNGLFHWDIGDHMALDPRAEAFSASAFYYHHLCLAEEFAGILKKKADSTRFGQLKSQVKRSIISKYLVPGTGRFDNGTQSAQLFALWYDLSPEKAKSFEVLMAEFKRHNMHVSSGIYGVMMMFDILRINNRNDVAYQIANQTDYPGWGYMLSKGATTLWESWEYPDNATSQNHPMFGSIDEWFYRSILGINPAAPGFKKITIKPEPAGDLSWAKGSYISVAGLISSNWKFLGGKFILDVSIPANTTAEIWIPSKIAQTILESGSAIPSNHIRFSDGYAIVQVGSGDYSFTSVVDH